MKEEWTQPFVVISQHAVKERVFKPSSPGGLGRPVVLEWEPVLVRSLLLKQKCLSETREERFRWTGFQILTHHGCKGVAEWLTS